MKTDFGSLYRGDVIVTPDKRIRVVEDFLPSPSNEGRPDDCSLKLLGEEQPLVGRLGTPIDRLSEPWWDRPMESGFAKGY